MNRWKDALGDTRTAASGAPAVTLEAFRGTKFRMPFTIYDQDDEFYFIFQINHDYNMTDSFKLHAHTLPMANGSGNVVLSGYYTWCQGGTGTVPALPWTVFSVTTPIVAGDQYIQKYIDLATVAPPATPKSSDLLLVFLQRPGASDATDTYHTAKDHGTAKANFGILAVDVHYRCNGIGSIPEFIG